MAKSKKTVFQSSLYRAVETLIMWWIPVGGRTPYESENNRADYQGVLRFKCKCPSAI